MDQKPLKLAIVGGGIAGLTLALCLNKLIPNHRKNVEIDIYEASTSLKAQIGAGIGVWGIAWVVFEALGIDKELLALSLNVVTDKPVKLIAVRKSDQAEGKDLFTVTTGSGRNIQFHRGDFQAVLLKHVPETVTIHTRKRLSTYTQDENGVTMHFEDGTTAHADVVAGADGLQSPVRRKLVEETGKENSLRGHSADPYWTGIVLYRDLVPREKFVEQGWPEHRVLSTWACYMGKTGRVMAYPVSNGAQVNVVVTRTWRDHEGTQFRNDVMADILRSEGYERPTSKQGSPKIVAKKEDSVLDGDVWAEEGGTTVDGKRQKWFSRVSPEEVKHSYKGWEPEMQVILNGMESPVAWAIHGVGKLKTFHSGRVCLLGDAAHALQPQHAAGSAMAIVDAYVLAHLFARAVSADSAKLATHSGLNTILDIYDQVRRKGAQHCAAASRAGNFHFDGYVEEADGSWRAVDTNSKEDVKRLEDDLTNGWSYAWDRTSTPKAVEEALNMLKESY